MVLAKVVVRATKKQLGHVQGMLCSMENRLAGMESELAQAREVIERLRKDRSELRQFLESNGEDPNDFKDEGDYS